MSLLPCAWNAAKHTLNDHLQDPHSSWKAWIHPPVSLAGTSGWMKRPVIGRFPSSIRILTEFVKMSFSSYSHHRPLLQHYLCFWRVSADGAGNENWVWESVRKWPHVSGFCSLSRLLQEYLTPKRNHPFVPLVCLRAAPLGTFRKKCVGKGFRTFLPRIRLSEERRATPWGVACATLELCLYLTKPDLGNLHGLVFAKLFQILYKDVH